MQFQSNKNLETLNTFGLEQKAKLFVQLTSKEDFLNLIKSPEFANNKTLFLGGGSNILFTKDYDGIVALNSCKGIQTASEAESYIEVKVQGGENWHNFVLHSIQQNWGGLQNMSLIPGTVGAAPIQNIGAYGSEVKDCITEVEFYDFETKEWKIFNNHQCQFDYRNSYFKKRERGSFFIQSVSFRLEKEPHTINTKYGDISKILRENTILNPSISDISKAVIQIRQSKLPDPKELGNAGSFFKNPVIDKNVFHDFNSKFPEAPFYKVENGVKIPAGWLIEQAGWKGKVIGKVGSHKKQALVLVNYGDARGIEIKNLASNIIKDIKNKFGIDIEPEVNIL